MLSVPGGTSEYAPQRAVARSPNLSAWLKTEQAMDFLGYRCTGHSGSMLRRLPHTKPADSYGRPPYLFRTSDLERIKAMREVCPSLTLRAAIEIQVAHLYGRWPK